MDFGKVSDVRDDMMEELSGLPRDFALDVTTFNDPFISAPVITALIRACHREAKFSVGYLGWQNDFDNWLEMVRDPHPSYQHR